MNTLYIMMSSGCQDTFPLFNTKVPSIESDEGYTSAEFCFALRASYGVTGICCIVFI